MSKLPCCFGTIEVRRPQSRAENGCDDCHHEAQCANHTDTSRSGDLVERWREAERTRLIDRIEALEAENERLRETLEAVWKEATTMRNASKLVGPYPKEPASNRVWARSMYHAGRKLHALIKPVRAALGEKQ